MLRLPNAGDLSAARQQHAAELEQQDSQAGKRAEQRRYELAQLVLACPRARGEAIMPSQIGSKIPVSSRLGISSPNEQPPAPCAPFTNVPEPARRSTSPAACRSLTARPIVIRET